MPVDPGSTPACWSCGESVLPARLRVESVLRTRSGADGGPFQSFRCSGCGAENGVLLDRRGRGLLYPLEGREEPGWLDRIIAAGDPERRERAAAWWRRHGDRVTAFIEAARRRRGGPTPHTRPPRQRPRVEARGSGSGNATPTPPLSDEPKRPAARPGSPLHDLGLPGDATEREIRRAFRRTLKRIHPDRVDQDDALAVTEANDAVRRLRSAYETALRDLGVSR